MKFWQLGVVSRQLLPRNIKKIYKIMKLSFLFIFFALVQVTATSYSQAINLDVNNTEIRQIIKSIEQQTDYRFFYTDGLTDLSRRVSLSISGQNIENVLSELLDDTQLGYRIIDNKLVMLAPKEAMLQGIVVTGTVTDGSGEPMPGVNVVVKGSTTGVISGFDGKYTITVPNKDAVLVFSFIGYATQEIVIGDRTTINIALAEDTREIEEVVVVGYGTQKKVNLTGAVGVAGSDRLENRTITSVGQGLQGVIPGLNITYDSGDPNESADFNIRGFESINGGSPLILVDGVPMNVEKINTNDIKSVSVLKDASSAAIYGARAAFGVILVETKKGQAGKTNISVSAQMTLQKAIFPSYQPLSEGGTARKVFNDAFKLTRGTDLIPLPVIDAALAYQEIENPTEDDAWMYYNNTLYPLTNFYMKDIVFRDFAPQQQYDFNINGASEKASYYVSIGMIDKQGFFKYGNEDYKRYNILSKIDFHVNDWLTLEEKVSFASVVNNVPHEYADRWYRNSIVRHFYMPVEFPDLTYYKEPGDREQYAHLIGMYMDNQNPLPILKKGGRDTRVENDIWLTQGVTITPIKGLKIKGDFSYRYFWLDEENVASKVDVLKGSTGFALNDIKNIIDNGTTANDFMESRFDKNTYYVFNAFAEYTLAGKGNHEAKALIGFNQEYGKTHRVTTRSTQLIYPDINSLSATTGVKTNSDGKNEIMLRGLFYRFNYSYKNKYLFEANGRYDGTSRFPKKDRFGFFPSFSAGWRLSEEPFMNGTKGWLDNFKIRGSYGQLGNQNVGSYYPYISSMSPGTSTFLLDNGGTLTNTLAPGNLVSSTLTWETVISKNIGVDFTILNRKLDVSFDYFVRDTKDMLMEKTYPGTLGADAPSENAADLKNAGWELAVTWSDKINKDWLYHVNISLSDYQTEITKYDNPTGAIDSYYVGKKVGEIWGYKTVGLFQTDEELANAADQSRIGTNWRLGDVHFANLDDDNIITTGSKTLDDTGDLIRIGNSTPRYAFGINAGVKFKNFSLDVFAQGIMKRDWYPSTSNFLRFFPFKTLSIEQWWIDDSWTPDNRDAYFPLMQYAYSDGKNFGTQTRYLQNAAYIRLKNVTLSYDIPVKFVDRAQVYINATNLWEASGVYKTLDPEQPRDLQGRYMFQRSFTVGLRVTL